MKKSQTHKLVVGAILSALIIVLQILSDYIKFGPASITLALAPIIIGGALYGKKMGAFLGLIFAIAVLVAPSTAAFYAVNWWATIIIVLTKSILSSFFAAWVYELVSKKNILVAVVAAGIVLPVINTGVFIVGAYFFFAPMFEALMAFIAANFGIELGVNLVLSTGITTVIKAVKKSN